MEKQKSIYVLLAHTHTAVGSLVRKFGNVHYNHSALSLDKDLSHLYSFGRPEHVSLFRGRFVDENSDRYTFSNTRKVPCVVIEIPVSEEDYQTVQNKIYEIEADKEYMYNLMSVLTYPLSGGFHVYKSFSCIEFVMAMLKMIRSELKHPAYSYTPDDVYKLYQDYIIYEGDLNEYIQCPKKDEPYFSKMTLALFCLNVFGFYKMMERFMISAFIEML